MNFKTACVGIGMSASTLLGGCGQKAVKVIEDMPNIPKVENFVVDKKIFKGDTVLSYFKKPLIVGDMVINGKNITKKYVGDMHYNKGDIVYVNQIYRDVKLPKGAEQVNIAKGDSIDYIIK